MNKCYFMRGIDIYEAVFCGVKPAYYAGFPEASLASNEASV